MLSTEQTIYRYILESYHKIKVAQRKRGGPITHRSQDRNLALIYLYKYFFDICVFHSSLLYIPISLYDVDLVFFNDVALFEERQNSN
jgi:hypothetical protein